MIEIETLGPPVAQRASARRRRFAACEAALQHYVNRCNTAGHSSGSVNTVDASMKTSTPLRRKAFELVPNSEVMGTCAAGKLVLPP